jgi:hypothetical protein
LYLPFHLVAVCIYSVVRSHVIFDMELNCKRRIQILYEVFLFQALRNLYTCGLRKYVLSREIFIHRNRSQNCVTTNFSCPHRAGRHT